MIVRQSIDALMAQLGAAANLKVYGDRPHLVLQARERADTDRDVLDFLERIRLS
ncbi:MAG: hypothetical protein NTZ14_09005 [Hyphomicrobiales bacterium]|nr:hypothetical protein [Hyphomicrobiales bacterium]